MVCLDGECLHSHLVPPPLSSAVQLLTAFDPVTYHCYHVKTKRVYLVIRAPVWDVIYTQNKNMVSAEITM